MFSARPTSAKNFTGMDTVTHLVPVGDWHVGVGVFVVRPDGKFLVGLRKGSHAADCWGFPGGHVDPGETWVQCAVRETFEETNIILGRVNFLTAAPAIFPERNRSYVTLFMTANVDEGIEPVVAEPHKVECWRWVSWEEMCELPVMAGIDVLMEQKGFSYRAG